MLENLGRCWFPPPARDFRPRISGPGLPLVCGSRAATHRRPRSRECHPTLAKAPAQRGHGKCVLDRCDLCNGTTSRATARHNDPELFPRALTRDLYVPPVPTRAFAGARCANPKPTRCSSTRSSSHQERTRITNRSFCTATSDGGQRVISPRSRSRPVDRSRLAFVAPSPGNPEPRPPPPAPEGRARAMLRVFREAHAAHRRRGAKT